MCFFVGISTLIVSEFVCFNWSNEHLKISLQRKKDIHSISTLEGFHPNKNHPSLFVHREKKSIDTIYRRSQRGFGLNSDEIYSLLLDAKAAGHGLLSLSVGAAQRWGGWVGWGTCFCVCFFCRERRAILHPWLGLAGGGNREISHW